jgi:hypothetical protein
MLPRFRILGLLSLLALSLTVSPAVAQQVGEAPALGNNRITQADIINNVYTLLEIRKKGREIFSTPFNTLDGFGDGPLNTSDPTSPGGRPTLQDNGNFLRVNGLDSQACVECHGVLSNASIPPKFGVGGVGGVGANAMAGPTEIDVDDSDGNGFAFYDGRFINPPFIFGSGGVELVGKEMTAELQEIKQKSLENPGVVFQLDTHGVNFGSIVSGFAGIDTSNVQGIDDDLVVRPFGRKGEFISTRAFDRGAMAFHFGMQPVESVGYNVDDDGDGYVNEILEGELSALHIFSATAERPIQGPTSFDGFNIFVEIGCAECHVPNIPTRRKTLTMSHPEVEDNPNANVYFKVDLTSPPTNFTPTSTGGVNVPMFSDLKRHHMGPVLEENTGGPLDPLFITARLWGVADTGPWMHDGRALTLTEAILLHGGEADIPKTKFENLSNSKKLAVLGFLRSLRTPTSVGTDLD